MHHMNRFVSGLGSAGSSHSGAKRPFDQVEDDDAPTFSRQRPKLPPLSSVVLEAVRMDNMQKLCSSLEPIIRKVVGEELERAFAKLNRNSLESRTSSVQIQGSSESDFCLYFATKLALPLFTGGKVEGEGGLPVHIVLKDDVTRQPVNIGPLSSAKLEVVVLDGDFANEDDDWTAEDFEKYVVKERDGKRPLLAGDLTVSLKEGVGTLGDLTFTDNSSWIRSRKFRLGVRVARGFGEGIRIKESKTEAFTVKDHRGELYKKHYPPRLNDEVWRLDKIGKDGAFHRRLQEHNITTVEEFLRFYMMGQHKLRTILGNGMSNKMWDSTIDHAKTCVLSEKLYVYYAEDVGVIFNNIYELLGVTSNDNYTSAESLDEKDKVRVDRLVKIAYENWSNMNEYDGSFGNEILSSHPHVPLEIENNGANHELAGFFNHQTGELQSMSTPTTSIPVANGPPAIYGYGSENGLGYINQGNCIIQSNVVFNPADDCHGQSSPTISLLSFPTNGGPANNGVARGPSQSMISRSFGDYTTTISQPGLQVASIEWQRYSPHFPEYYISEEAMREQTTSILGTEEMQQLIGSLYIPRTENNQLQGEDSYFEGLTSPPAYMEGRSRSSGKGYVGWLKLKAALRWGIFIRKIVRKKAIQRAQLEEIED